MFQNSSPINQIMATEAATRTYLKDVIGLGNNDEGTAKANAVIAEGLDDLADLYELSEDDGIKRLCSNVRKPSGTIEDPSWVAPDPNPAGETAPLIPRTGHAIPAICEQRLALAAYGAKLYNSVRRPVTSAILNRSRLREFKNHKNMIDNHNDPESLPEISKSYTIMKFLDQFPTHLREMLGVSKVALSYVIRDNATPPAIGALQANKPWSVGYESVMEELIELTPHEGPTYEADNAQVYNLLATNLAGTSAMTSITRHQRRRDGRSAYLDLITHNMGSAKWEKTVEIAEGFLSTRVWNGRNARYPLRVHISRHREAHNVLVRASFQINYTPPNDASRVRYLLNSIQTADPTICSAKTAIQADSTKKNNFEEAADFLLITAPPPKASQPKVHRVSAVSAKRGKIKIGPKTGVEIRYFKKHEWHKLTKDEQEEVRSHRKKRKVSGEHDGKDAKIAALEAQLQEQSQLIAALRTNKEKGGGGESLPPISKGNPLKPPKGFTQRE